MRNAFLGLMLLVATSANAQQLTREYIRLCDWMTGSFSSEQQASRDTAYYDIDLHMYRIWPHRTDGYWLYVEQAVATNPEKPYRQRVYRVTDLKDGTFESVVYEFDDPLQYAGEWKKEKPLEGLDPDALLEREGCAIILRWNPDGYYEGRNGEGTCESRLREATYATSQVKVYPQLLDSWDRGFDDERRQVWGAESGPYHFIKMVK